MKETSSSEQPTTKAGPPPSDDSSQQRPTTPGAAIISSWGRKHWFGVVLVAFIACTVVAFTQDPRPDAYANPTLQSFDWWRYPIEENAHRRLPLVEGDLNDVFVQPGTGRVWAVGTGGLLLRSEDGISWTRDTVFTARRPAPAQQTIQQSSVQASPPQQQAQKEDRIQHARFISQERAPQQDNTGLPSQDPPEESPPSAASSDSVLTASLRSGSFGDPDHGWIVGGDEGTLLYTADGGQSWTVQTNSALARHEGDLQDVHFIDAQNGWAVTDFVDRGYGVSILRTSDGGQTWTEHRIPDMGAPLAGAHFIDEQTGWVVGAEGTVVFTNNGGQSWTNRRARDGSPNDGQTSTSDAVGGRPEWGALDLTDVYFLDAQTGWALATEGTLLHTADGGQTWTTQPVSGPVSGFLAGVHFVNPQTGWIVGSEGAILHTTDGGESWTRVSRVPATLITPQLQSSSSGGSPAGWLLRRSPRGDLALGTDDEGQSWTDQPVPEIDAEIRDIHYVDAQLGWAVEGDRSLIYTSNGGESWPELSAPEVPTLQGVHFADDQTGWVVGRGYDKQGAIHHTTNGGDDWTDQGASVVGGALTGVHFTSQDTGWSVGDRGLVLHTTNGGDNWTERSELDTEANLTDVYFTDAQTGWITGANDLLLRTTDGGQSWTEVDVFPYRSWPAPWYYLSLVFVGLLLVPALKEPGPVEAPEPSIANEGASDRPLEAGDRDALNLSAIARGLSGFVRNENTEPPLTVAVTGPWGSGKSSLMNLLRADLGRFDFRPVWFNAWHHQKEEHLLAALLENIRTQAVPPPWTVAGLTFRVRLLQIRLQRFAPLVVPLSVLLAVLLGYLTQNPTDLLEMFNPPGELGPESSGNGVPPSEGGFWNEVLSPKGGFWALLFSNVVALALVTLRGLMAFGVTPAALMASLKRNVRIRDLKAQTSFRYRFKQQFREVTRALRPRTMVIFIDDLDRCRPQNVLELLEAVNFLVTSGECFIVLGMDLDRVQHYVEEGFSEVDEEGFAEHYLEKLVNIEVPIPEPTEDQLLDVTVPDTRDASDGDDEGQANEATIQRIDRALRWGRALLVPAVVAGAFLLTYQWSAPPSIEEGRSPPPENQSMEIAPDTSSDARPVPPDAVRGDTRSALTMTASHFEPGESSSFPITWRAFPLIVGVIVIGLGVWRLSIRPEVVVRDSPAFADALEIWHPLLTNRVETPRAAKRFVNRLRYYAMRQRSHAPPVPPAERIANWFGITTRDPERADRAEIPESTLVALGTMHSVDPSWLGREDVLSGDVFEVNQQAQREDMLKNEASPLRDLHETLKAHNDKFEAWPPSEQEVRRFRNIKGTAPPGP